MDTVTLLLVFAGLLVLLIVLVLLYVRLGRSKRIVDADTTAVTFETMSAVVHRTSSTNAQLNHAADTIIERYSTITDFEAYEQLLENLCIHPNADSKVILRLQRALIAANPKQKTKLEKILKLGLAGRK